ncbi:MAG TPA: hypothetical protein VLS93_14480 [Anaeromyxobacteraceae bacterium]|nr:hypothetical protein [Anaeromyxobacteraceae bacterium]
MDPGPKVSRARRAAPYLLAVAWLALGAANVARGLPHAGTDWRYRVWAFEHLCYSDVLSLGGDHYGAGGRPVPFLEDPVEYPVLLGLALWLPSFAPGGLAGHLAATAALLLASLLAAIWALARTPGAQPLWLAATPALAVYGLLNWDLLPVALLALAALALSRGRAAWGGALAALGVSAKLFPGVLVPPALAALAGGPDRRGALRFAAALGLALVLVNGPVAAFAWDGFTWFFRFNAGRGAENSAWHALGLGPGPLLEALSLGPLLAASAYAAWGAARAARAGDPGRAVRLGASLALVAWIATNKVWSPQYALYGFLAAALAAAPARAFLPLSILALADFVVAFEVRARRWDPFFRDVFFHPLGLVRTAAWLALAAWMARELWREVSSPSSR